MRLNQAFTHRGFDFSDGATLMSTTDVQGNITYANAASIAVWSCERDEFTGQPHNIVRHPGVPREAFADRRGAAQRLSRTAPRSRSWCRSRSRPCG